MRQKPNLKARLGVPDTAHVARVLYRTEALVAANDLYAKYPHGNKRKETGHAKEQENKAIVTRWFEQFWGKAGTWRLSTNSARPTFWSTIPCMGRAAAVKP